MRGEHREIISMDRRQRTLLQLLSFAALLSCGESVFVAFETLLIPESEFKEYADHGRVKG